MLSISISAVVVPGLIWLSHGLLFDDIALIAFGMIVLMLGCLA